MTDIYTERHCKFFSPNKSRHQICKGVSLFSATNFCLYYRAAADVGANSNLKLHSLAKISLQWCAGARARRDGSGNTGTVGKIQCGDGASLWSQQSLPPHEPAPPYKNLQELQSYQTLQKKHFFSYSLLQEPHSRGQRDSCT